MRALVVGVGNRTRGDDAAGPEVATRVAALGLPGIEVVVHDEPLGLVEHLAAHDHVVVVDATAARGTPGAVRVLRVGPVSLRPGTPAVGTHGLGVAEAVELARALGRLPARLTVVGVEGRAFGPGTGFSAEVRDRLDDAVRAVLDDLRSAGEASTPASR